MDWIQGALCDDHASLQKYGFVRADVDLDLPFSIPCNRKVPELVKYDMVARLAMFTRKIRYNWSPLDVVVNC